MPDDALTDPQSRDLLDQFISINNVIEKICGIRETNHIMDIIISELVTQTDSDQGVISLITNSKVDALSTVIRMKDQNRGDLPSYISVQLLGWVLKNNSFLKIDDLDSDDRFTALSSHDGKYKHILCYPMIGLGELTGLAILVRNAEKPPFEDKHCRMMGILVPQSAQILANAKLLGELKVANELLELSRKKIKRENVRLNSEVGASFTIKNIIGKSPGMKKAAALVSKLSTIDSPVLITGDTGTGKGLIAEAIHRRGERKDKPFAMINYGSKSETLLESELFGHMKGSFAGAIRNKIGMFKEADGGTVFLDDIGDFPLSTQAAILRVIQNGEIRPVGAIKPEMVNVRVICATNKNLAEQIAAKRFYEDLFYQLSTYTIELPALRERKEDIPLLVSHFINKVKTRIGRDNLSISPAALDIMIKYNWPANVRELESEVERLAVTCGANGIIEPRDFSPAILSSTIGGPA
jgi:transcriptional regulator with GAF, ATPase, and Fis domain